jgi:hypothetical protein
MHAKSWIFFERHSRQYHLDIRIGERTGYSEKLGGRISCQSPFVCNK